MKTKTVSPKKQSKKSLPHRRGGKGRGSLSFFRRIPSWAMWLGGVLVTAAYIFFFYRFFVSPYSSRWRAIYGDTVYPAGYEVRGIDISHYQNRINWEKLCKDSIGDAPVSFVFVKATEGGTLRDEYFKKNFSDAKKNGLIRGAYHFFVPGVDPRRQADFFLKIVKLETGDLPPMLDVEKRGNLTPEQLRRDVKVWLDVVEEAYGMKPILYSNLNFKLENLSTSEFDAYPFWIAHYYVSEIKYDGKWAFWQHTDCGKVAGITGLVDCNVFNGTLEELKALTLPEPE